MAAPQTRRSFLTALPIVGFLRVGKAGFPRREGSSWHLGDARDLRGEMPRNDATLRDDHRQEATPFRFTLKRRRIGPASHQAMPGTNRSRPVRRLVRLVPPSHLATVTSSSGHVFFAAFPA